MYAFRDTFGPVDLAFTDRFGGVEAAADFAPGDGVVRLTQVHGAEVAEAEIPFAAPPEADGVVTGVGGLTLMIRVADCVPVLLADPQSRVIGAAHAGRLGVMHGVVPATVERMRSLGAGEITAWIGPHICGLCYEVPAEMRAEVAAVVPSSSATTSWATPALDLGAGVRAQLAQWGVAVRDTGPCTRETADLFSYRREGAAAGRQAAMIRCRP
ncbi:MAG: polyphenol oxidase family protein [Nocardioidaceae bacterium]|nr:polyphenol oxidase family protein [Nocardioidaceae bacterium]